MYSHVLWMLQSMGIIPSARPKIFLSGTNGLPGRYGGWDQLLSHLSRHLSTSHDVVVNTSIFDAEPGVTYCDGALIDIINYQANGPQSILYDVICMYRSLKHNATCVMLGTSGGLFFPLFRLLGLKIVLNPDGEEWNRGKWNLLAKLYLRMSDIIATLFASAVVSDHPNIQKRVDKLRKVRSYYIPYGGDNALSVDFDISKGLLPEFIRSKQYVFGVCRIEPENNVHLCLEALSITQIPLVFVGNWQKSHYGRDLFERYSKCPNITLLNPIYDPIKLGSLRSNCNLYFHGHTVGGTNPSLVEALCLGLRIICHDNEFNRTTSYDNAYFFRSLSDLIEIIVSKYNNATSLPASEKDFFRNAYSWHRVVASYEKVIMHV